MCIRSFCEIINIHNSCNCPPCMLANCPFGRQYLIGFPGHIANVDSCLSQYSVKIIKTLNCFISSRESQMDRRAFINSYISCICTGQTKFVQSVHKAHHAFIITVSIGKDHIHILNPHFLDQK